MKLVTWNINSVRLRMPLIQKLTEEEKPDIICLQETKVADEQFPKKAIKALGYEHLAFSGQKSYNGVAILSKIPLANVRTERFVGSEDKRHIAATLPNGTEVHNFYVPAGGDEPDVNINPKYQFKLDFMDEMHRWFGNERSHTDAMIMVGDINIAPHEHDVWSHKQLLKIISHTPPETERMHTLQKALNWVDVGRHFVPLDQKLYSWWSYRNRDWRASNRGRRLDHIWTTQPLKDTLKSFHILENARDWEKPSDHVPVIAEFKVG